MVHLDHIWKAAMSDRQKSTPAGTDIASRGNLLPAVVRRDIADLNRLFIEYALEPGLGSDPWFCLPARAAAQLAGAPPEARDRVAQGPFTLFELALPGPDDGLDWYPSAVADAEAGHRDRIKNADERRAFALVALGV